MFRGNDPRKWFKKIDGGVSFLANGFTILVSVITIAGFVWEQAQETPDEKLTHFFVWGLGILLICSAWSNIFFLRKLKPYNSSMQEVSRAFRLLGTKQYKAISDIVEKERVYLQKIKETTEEKKLKLLKQEYEIDFERLFCTPAMDIVNCVCDMMANYAKHRFGVDERFRVIVKIIENNKPKDIQSWEFANVIWDKHAWEDEMKHKGDSEVKYRHRIDSNSAINDLAEDKIPCFAENDLSSTKYQSHGQGYHDRYNAKILTKITVKKRPDGNLDSGKKRFIFGFLSIDTMNKKNLELFSTNQLSVPLNIAWYAAEALAIILFKTERFSNNLELAYEDRLDSIVHKNRRYGESRGGI